MRGTKDLTVGKERKLILQFAIPMLIGSLFQQLYNVVDSIIVGNYLGKEELAAVGISFPIIFMLVSLLIGLTIGLSVIISQYFGAKDYKKVREAVDTIYISLFFASIVLTALGLIFSRDIMELLKVPPDVIDYSVLYFNIFTGGLVFLFGFNATNAILRGMGDTKTPLVFLIISTLLNIFLDIFFITVMGWGIEAVAIATVVSQFVAFFLAALYLNKKHPLIRISFVNLVFNRTIFRQSLKIGIPSGLQQSFVALGIVALIRIVNDFGTDAMAAFTITSRIDAFAAMPAMIFASALSSFVGQNIGAGKLQRIRVGFRETTLMTTMVALFISVVFIVFREPLVMAFNTDPMVVEIGSSYLFIVGFFYVIFANMFVGMAVMRGAGDAITPMFITLVALWIGRVPLSYILSRDHGTDGIWWGIPLAWCIGFGLALFFYIRGRWKRKAITKIETPLPDNEIIA
ncbi:MAG: MATE family efflux transporter [Marinilabiliales bacterium]|nr:MAG: MATE family efflux transporter [Marinilabiliales bacterium]